MSKSPIAESPWREFSDYYFAATPTSTRVNQNWDQFEIKYRSARRMGDQYGDPLGRAIIDRRVSRADFELALTRGIENVEAPDPILVEFFKRVDHIPDSIDMNAVERGAALLKQIPITVLVTHGVVAGFIFAAINPNSAIPLSLNKSIAQATRKRYIETTKYVADTAAQGGMSRFGRGLQSAIRVRLVHAFVRSEIARHFDWNSDAYDDPINPIPMLAAAAVPDVWAARFAQRNGCQFTADQLQDIATHNAYLAYLHGVPEDLIPTDYESYCDFLCWAICQSELPLPEDVQRVASVLKPLLENGYPLSTNSVTNWFFNQTIFTATRTIMGPQICDAYDIPRSRHAGTMSAALSVLNRMLVTARQTPGLRPIYKRGTLRYWDVTVPQLVERITGKPEVTYASTAKASA